MKEAENRLKRKESGLNNALQVHMTLLSDFATTLCGRYCCGRARRVRYKDT